MRNESHYTFTSSKSIKPLPSVSLNWVNCSLSLATQSGSDKDVGKTIYEVNNTMFAISPALIPVHVPNVFVNVDLRKSISARF